MVLCFLTNCVPSGRVGVCAEREAAEAQQGALHALAQAPAGEPAQGQQYISIIYKYICKKWFHF